MLPSLPVGKFVLVTYARSASWSEAMIVVSLVLWPSVVASTSRLYVRVSNHCKSQINQHTGTLQSHSLQASTSKVVNKDTTTVVSLQRSVIQQSALNLNRWSPPARQSCTEWHGEPLAQPTTSRYMSFGYYWIAGIWERRPIGEAITFCGEIRLTLPFRMVFVQKWWPLYQW